MMYDSLEDFEFDFIRRTKDILNNFRGEYEVTLLINSMLGLLIIPKEKHYASINDYFIDPVLFQKIVSKCSFPMDGKTHNLQYILRRLRNAAGHGHMKFEVSKSPNGEQGREIERVTFYDDEEAKRKGNNFEKYEFSSKLEISILKAVVNSFSDSILKLEESNH